MSLILESSVSEQDGCLEWDFVDDTGAYNVTTNPGGYGSPNITSASVTSATLLVMPYGYTVGYTFTFTIVSNEITAATVTDPAGTVTIILADMASVVFPFTVALPFTIIGEWLGNGVDSELTASAYYFEYNIVSGANLYTSSFDYLAVCQVCCCVRNAEADLDPSECTCENNNIEKVMRSQIFLDGAVEAMENGDVDKSYTLLMEAKTLCEGGCSTCG